MTTTSTASRGHAPRRVVVPAALIAVVMSIVLVWVGGCASQPPSPPRLAPPIPADQLDLSMFVAKPCELLRPDRVVRRHLSVPGAIVSDTVNSAVNGASATACRWNPTDTGHPHITVSADLTHNLEWAYQHRADFGSFRPTSVSHYPAVNTTPAGHEPTEGACTIRVGVANDTLLTITADYTGQQSRSATDPCPDASDIAFEIITQMLGSS